MGSPEKENRFSVKGVSVSLSEMLDFSKDGSSAEPIKSPNIDQRKAEKKTKSRNAGIWGSECLAQTGTCPT